MPDGSEMQYTPQAMGLSSYPLWIEDSNETLKTNNDFDLLHANTIDNSKQFQFWTGEALVLLSLDETIEILHKRMGHISKYRIKQMIDKGIIDYTKTDTDDFYNKHFCRSCMTNKLRRPTYNKSIPKANRPGARWYMDLTTMEDS